MRYLLIVLSAVAMSLPPAAADIIELSNGDRISGTIAETNDEGTVIENPVFGKVLIPHGHIVSVTPAADDDTEAAARAEAAEQAATDAQALGADTSAKAKIIPPPPPEPPGLFGTDFLRGWTKSIALGASGATGNSENLTLYFNANANYADDYDRWFLGAAYFLSTDSGNTSENRFWARLEKDWLDPESPWFYFAQGRYDWDDFQDWKHRISAHGGVGYELIDTEELQLRLKGGGGFSQTFSPDNFAPEALAGIVVVWQIDEHQSFNFASTIFPDLSDLGQFRTLSDVAWVADIDAVNGLSVKVGAEHEYQTNITSGKRNDLTYYAALVFGF